MRSDHSLQFFKFFVPEDHFRTVVLDNLAEFIRFEDGHCRVIYTENSISVCENDYTIYIKVHAKSVPD